MITFSIITVSYNAGGKLIGTIQSVLRQTYPYFEIVVKDGMSLDNSTEGITELDSRIHLYRCKDTGIYDAMNQALQYATGDYFLFLNCGDFLYKPDVLWKLNEFIESEKERAKLYYGDVYVRNRGGIICTPKTINNYILINRTICHQTILFSKDIFKECKYDNKLYKYAADMALYVRCIKEKKMIAKHVPIIIADYEGGGASEVIANKRLIISEKKKIMRAYLSHKEQIIVEFQRLFTLQVLKEAIGTNEKLIGLFELIASIVAKKRKEQYE